MIVNRVWLKKDVVHVVTFLALLSPAEDWTPARLRGSALDKTAQKEKSRDNPFCRAIC